MSCEAGHHSASTLRRRACTAVARFCVLKKSGIQSIPEAGGVLKCFLQYASGRVVNQSCQGQTHLQMYVVHVAGVSNSSVAIYY